MTRPRLPETSAAQQRARQAWNRGLTGTGRPARAKTAAIEECTVEVCGSPVTTGHPPAAGMVAVRGAAEGAAAHWYCPGRCAGIARARADLRSASSQAGGEQR
ncbi:hypothetical protein ACFOOM_07755 [Streptomyces echinoruber]|uniref:Uncharacterized protein n=1 Tax=Streptomyces echinoruber TaxID=68898 RepID=A0A918V8N8_9ACTN|nr:hypothetical protein [Streptomyces echinoruber]GGZ80469.1 hypothetical protein GCM10010389_17900 [Streptomyces echinoruber]